MSKKVIKGRSQFSSTLRNDLLNQLRKISEETDIPVSKLLDRAVDLLIKKMEEQ